MAAQRALAAHASPEGGEVRGGDRQHATGPCENRAVSRVFVTGGNGFIGSVVVRILLEQGHQVRCLLRPASNVERIAGLEYDRVDGDVREAALVLRGAAGCDAIVHLAGLSNWDDIESPLMEEVVVGGLDNVLQAARPTRSRVIFVSSILAIAGSREPRTFDETSAWTGPERRLGYSRWKRHAEAMCLDAWTTEGVPVVIVNPGEVYGPNDTDLITAGNLVDFARSNPVLVCTGGTLVAHVEDVALAIVRAMERGRPGERYILGGENLSIRQLARLCLELLGDEKRIVAVPNSLIRAMAAVGRMLPIPLPFNPHVIPYATRFWFMDSSKAQRELGVSFRSARETLRPTLEWLTESGRI